MKHNSFLLIFLFIFFLLTLSMTNVTNIANATSKSLPLPVFSIQNSCSASSITLGQEINGSLSQGDCILESRFTDRYIINGNAGQQITVVITATIDPRIVIRSLNGIALTSINGDPNETTLLAFTPATNEQLFIDVTSQFSETIGNYIVRYFQPNCSGNGNNLSSGQRIDATLTIDDCFENDRFLDTYRVNAIAGQQISVAVSATIDPRILLRKLNGVVLASTDGDPNEITRLVFTPTITEPLILQISSQFSFRFANYTLMFNEPDCDPNPISNNTINGSLSTDDCIINDRFTDRYAINGVAGQQITIMVTANIDPRIAIKRANNILIADEDGDPNRVTQLVITPATTEPLILEVTSQFILRQGDYSLRVITGPDFSLSFSNSEIQASRGSKNSFTVNITRIGGLTGNITITPPDTKSIKVTLTPSSSQTTSGSSVRFDYKVKKKAPLGTQQLTFTGRDSAGNIRTATLRFTIS